MSDGVVVNPNPLERTVNVSRFMLMCCYLAGIGFAVVYLTSEPYKRDRLIRFHSFQSIMFFPLWLLVHLVSLLSPLALQVGRIVEFVFFLTWLFLMISAYRGKTVKLPLIGKLAEARSILTTSMETAGSEMGRFK